MGAPVGLRRFWLGALIRNMSEANGAAGRGASVLGNAAVAQSFVIWFLWHFTGAAVPKPLRPLLRAAIVRGEREAKRHIAKGTKHMQIQSVHAFVHQSRLLGWLLATDPAMGTAAAAAREHTGELLLAQQGDLTNMVRALHGQLSASLQPVARRQSRALADAQNWCSSLEVRS